MPHFKLFYQMHKTFEQLDNHHFPGDWAVADTIKQYLHGRCKKITKDNKIKKQAEDEQKAKECHRHQAILQKWTVLLEEDDPESLAIEAANASGTSSDEEDLEENWPPVHRNKKARISSGPAREDHHSSSNLSEPEEECESN